MATIGLVSCKKVAKNQKFTVVTTTSMLTDLVKNIGGDKIIVKGIMGAGVDPHLYKATEGDVALFANADVIVYNGLHLEGKLAEVFEQMNQQGKKTIPVANWLSSNQVIQSANFKNNYDPHIWFSIQNWITITKAMQQFLMKENPSNATYFQQKGDNYIQQLKQLQSTINKQVAIVPKSQRVLVTAHDAFSYFGKDFDFEVVGLQGISTATEAGVKDVQKVSDLIIQKNIKAVFIESSVPKRTIEALQAAVNAKGKKVAIGGQLYSDALGNSDSVEGTYIGMYQHNVKTILAAIQ